MPDFDFDAFNHDNYEENGRLETPATADAEPAEPTAEATPVLTEELISAPVISHSTDEVDKW